MFFGSFGSQRTPTPTSRDFQEKVVRLAQQERYRTRCASAQPTRSSNPTHAQQLSRRPPSAGRTVTEKVHTRNTDEERVPTPELKELVCASQDKFIHDADAVAKHLNGSVSPSRTRVKRTLAETVNEVARSRSVSPVDGASTPVAQAKNAGGRPASASSGKSPSVFHTVGPREFARLMIKMRSQSPWALHVEEDQMTYKAQQAAAQVEKRAKQALWVESLSQAVEARRQSSREARVAAMAAEVDSLDRAKSLSQLLSYEKRQISAQKLCDQRAEYSALQRRRQMEEAMKLTQRSSAFAAQENLRCEKERERAAEQLKKREKLEMMRSDVASSAKRKEDAREREEDPAEAEARNSYLRELEQRRDLFQQKISNSRRQVESRASLVAARIRPSRKQQALDRIDEVFDATAQHLLATNISLAESHHRAARLRCQSASEERSRMMQQRDDEKRRARSRALTEEIESIARDRQEKALYDQTMMEFKAKQVNEVREQLELQRRVSMKRTLDDATQAF